MDELIRLMVGREMRDMYPKEEVPSSDEEVLRVEGLSRGVMQCGMYRFLFEKARYLA